MNLTPAVGPFIGFGVGYALGRLGVGPVNASIIGMGVSIGWSTLGPRAMIGMASSAGHALWVTPVGPIVAAIVAPVAVGAAVSYGIAGKEGLSDYKDFLTEPLKMPSRVIETFSMIDAELQTNRAVPNNAAGVPAGQQVRETVAPGLQDQHDWAVENRERWITEMNKRPYG